MKIAKRLSAIVLAVALVLIFLPEQVVKAGNSSAAKLKNPVHHCDTDNMYEKDYSTYSYVYFGSYPQTEVKNADIISQIDANLSGSGDTWVNGIKYRKVNYIDSNYSRFFDEGLEGDKETAYRYFKWEKIRWKVLKTDGNKALIVSEKGIDSKKYNTFSQNVTWESCSLRKWLNNHNAADTNFIEKSFFDTAFNSAEQSAILQTIVNNPDNDYTGISGGNYTKDKVFLLSIDEAKNRSLGFCDDNDCDSSTRWVKTTDYDHIMGTTRYADDKIREYLKLGSWWLRSPGGRQYYAAMVSYNGSVGSGALAGYDVSNGFSVVPALYLDLSSDTWIISEEEEVVYDDNLVHEIHFEIPEPEAGELPSNNIKLTTVPANAYTSQFVNAIENAASSSWKESSDNVEFAEMESGKTFETEKYYKTTISTIYAINTIAAGIMGTLFNTDVANGFASDMKIYVNGKVANSEDWTFKCRYNIELADVICDEVFEYTGNNISPKIEVRFDGKNLKGGDDYSVVYTKNKQPGTAVIQIKGIGWYKGIKKFYFEIKPKERKVIDEVVAISNTQFIPVLGKNMDNPTINIISGMPVKYNAGGAVNWKKKSGNTWEECYWEEKFTCGTYRLSAIFGLYNDDQNEYSFSDNIKVTVDGQQWTIDGDYVDMGYYGFIVAHSPEYVIEHDWGEWKVTTPATKNSEGVETRVCKNDPSHIETRKISLTAKPGTSVEAVDRLIKGLTNDKDPAGSDYQTLQAKASKVTKSSIKLSWKKVSGAKGYIIYGNKCGKKNKYEKITTTAKTSYTQKKLKKGTYYKYLVVAFDKDNKVLSTSKTIHAVTAGGKYDNAKSVTTKAKKNKVTIKAKKTFKLKAKALAKNKKLKMQKHRAIQYESTNTKIASVNSKGVIKGKAKGTCYVYVYAMNGVSKKIKVTVK